MISKTQSSLRNNLPKEIAAEKLEKKAPAKKETAAAFVNKPEVHFADTKKNEAQFSGANLRHKLEKKLNALQSNISDKLTAREFIKKAELDPLNPEEAKLIVKLSNKYDKYDRLLDRQKDNNKIIKGNGSLTDKLKAANDNAKIDDKLKKLDTELSIIGGHLSAIQRNDNRAVRFFEAMAETNKTSDPSEMNRGDAFRQSLSPESRKVYDETLAKLRRDPRIEFKFLDGAKDTLAFREIALRGMAAAAFGRPQDLEERIVAGAKASENGDYTITYVPDRYDHPDRKKKDENWGALANQTGITAKQGFTIKQIGNENDNLFIHEFSHTLQSDSNGKVLLLPPEFSVLNIVKFYAAFDNPNFQKYMGETKVTVETFPGIQNRFRQNPEALKTASPAMYQLMVEYSGFDPISGNLI